MNAMNSRSIVWLAPFVFFLQSCLFSSGGRSNGGPEAEPRGFYEFGNPTSWSSLSLDSTYQVQWTASDSAGTGSVRLSVYKGDVFIGNLATALPATGVYSWGLAASRSLGGYRMGSGSGYRLRIVNATDSSKWDFSPSFTLVSRYSGTVSLTAPTHGTEAKMDSLLAINWSTTGEVGPFIGLQLYKDTVWVRNIVTTLTPSLGTYSWRASVPALGSGDDYHIRVFATYDPSISQMGPAFRISSSWSGSFSFRYPGSDDTLAAGTYDQASWTTTGNPGASAQLTLWRDSTLLSTVGSANVGEEDSTTWYVSSGLTTGRYRLRLASTSDPGIYAFSPAFFVNGTDPDEYEKDDSLSSAKAIDTDGKPQKRNLTLQDADWMRFETKKGMRYLVTLHAATTVYLDVADSAGRQLKEQYVSFTQFSYVPTYAGKHYLHVFPVSSTAPGPYQISVSEYDSAGAPLQAEFTSPDEKTTWAAGSSYNIVWTPDTLVFGATVTLSLYNDTTLVQYVASSVVNNGSYAWTVPEGLYTGSKYRIRIAPYSGTGGYAYSPYFSISGTTPDAYEPDNSRGTAKPISPDSAMQQRNIMANDTDWVRFDGTAGKTYLASVNAGTAYVYLYLTDSAGLTLSSQSGSRFSLSYIPTRSGKYYLRVQPYSGGFGSYTLSLFEPGKNGLPVKFSAPDTSTVWSAGSSYTLNWVSDSAAFGPQVTLELYNDSVLVQSIYTGLGNSGSYLWTIQAGLYTSGKYRIRLSSYSNHAIYGFSPYFTISGIVPDAYEPDNVRSAAKAITADGAAQQRNIVYGDTDWVRIDAVAGKTYLAAANSSLAGVSLAFTDSIGNVLVSQSGARVTNTYSPPRSGKYYLRVQYYSSPGAYSLTLVSFDAALGGAPVKFTNPDTATVWSSGSIYTATWVPDSALFGSTVTLSLYLEGQLVYNLSSYTANSGTVSVTLPYGLATGKNYRLRLTNYSNYQVYGSSQLFSIAGMAPDTLEPNDTLTAAKAVVSGSPRMALSLSYRDKDWFRFTAKAQMMYVFQAVSSSSLPTLLRLWPATGVSPLLTATRSTLDSVNSLSWLAPADGEYLVSVEGGSSSSSTYGTYGFEIKEIEPSAYKFSVSAPPADTAFLPGATLAIKWSDPASVKGSVDIFLYNAASVVTTIVASTSNTGSYTWSVPPGLPSRSDYYVKVISRMSSAITGSSGAFSISP